MKLKDWRTANRYSQPAFAKLLLEKEKLKVDRTTVWYWENGTMPREEALLAIKKVTRGKVGKSSFKAAQ